MDPLSALIQRAIDNVVANWQLLLIRLAENVALILMVLAVVFGGLIPAVLYGIFGEMWGGVEAPDEALARLLEHPFLLVYVFLLILVVVLVAVVVHSFVQAGIVGCYIDGERQARQSAAPSRSRFRVFTPGRWSQYAGRFWWPVFLIYNITWGIFGALLLIPLAVVSLITFLGRERPEVLVITCLGLVLIMMFLVVGGIVVQLWSMIAITLNVNGEGVREATRKGWQLLVTRPLPFGAMLLISIVVSFAAVGFVGGGSFLLGIVSAVPKVGLIFLPLQIIISLLQTAISVVIQGWFLAAVIAVALQVR